MRPNLLITSLPLHSEPPPKPVITGLPTPVDEGEAVTVTCTRPAVAVGPPITMVLQLGDHVKAGPTEGESLTWSMTPFFDSHIGVLVQCAAESDLGRAEADPIAVRPRRKWPLLGSIASPFEVK